jgi:hypothetical protein
LERFAWMKNGAVVKKLSKIERHYQFEFLEKKLIFFSQPNKKGHYQRIMGNEMSIKIDKSKKTLDISNKSWSSPINNDLNLMKIHVNVICKYDVTQEFHFRLMELKLFVHQHCFSYSMRGLNLILSICMGSSFNKVVKG